MKSILLSIKPKWTAKILNGEKTAEIRKTAPKEWTDYLSGKTAKKPEPMFVYIYCTKGDYIGRISKKYVGKVVARFTLNEVEEIKHRIKFGIILTTYSTYETATFPLNPLCDISCLTYEELDYYLKGERGYAWYISDLGIFGEPKELNEFYTLKCNQKKRPCNIKDVFGAEECHRICKMCKPLTKAPQSWCYVEEREDAE